MHIIASDPSIVSLRGTVNDIGAIGSDETALRCNTVRPATRVFRSSLKFLNVVLYAAEPVISRAGQQMVSSYGDHSPYKFLKIAPLPSRYVTNA